MEISVTRSGGGDLGDAVERCWEAPMEDHDLIEIENVEALSHHHALICDVDGVRVAVPGCYIEPGSEVQRPGDRGKLVLSVWLARKLGLVAPETGAWRPGAPTPPVAHARESPFRS